MNLFKDLFSPSLINSVFAFLSLFAWLGFLAAAALLIDKTEKNKKLTASLQKLETAFRDLDEQAKLIVKTDLELNKTQEALDKKVSGLYTLHKLSQAISTTLIEEEILGRVEESLILELGFEKCLILFIKDANPVTKLNIGFLEDRLSRIQSEIKPLLENKQLNETLFKQDETVSSIKLQDSSLLNKITSLLGLESFVISGIKTKEEFLGLIIMGNPSVSRGMISEGDEELVAILANQIGQAIENARLFEQTWRSHQELEQKVKQRTKELTQALEEINLISKRKSDFISAVSHELRTPLTSIKGYAAILAGGKLGKVSGPIKQRLEKIDKHSDELTKLINELLDISRVESGRIEMKLEPQGISSILDEISDLLMPQIKEKQIQLNITIPEGLKEVLVDKSQISRVFINLMANAIKFTPSGGTIEIKAKDAKQYIQIDVADSGIGISPADLERIFEEFYRVDNPINQQLKGTGLGLSLVKYIIEAHQGKLWAKSKPGEGSTFSFSLPKVNAEISVKI